MPAGGTGGYAPGPMRTGASSGSPLEHVLRALNQMRGTAIDTSSPAAPAWVENMAIARAIDASYGANARLSYLTDPTRTGAIARWEAIFGILPPQGATDLDRRNALAALWARLGATPSRQAIVDALTAALGPVFVAYINIPATQTLASTNPWYATTAHVLVHVQTPAGYTEGQFQAAVALIGPILDWMLPAWATWDWYRNGVGHPAGGFTADAGAGFYLDDPHNLDNEIFDV